MAYDGSRSMIVGLTHDRDGTPRTRLVKMLKVSIGCPKSKAIHVYIAPSKKWIVELGHGKDKKNFEFVTMTEAQKFYDEKRPAVPVRPYPTKFPYFTFLKIGMDGDYSPDWDAIAHHGPVPNMIKIVFLRNEPLEQAMQAWSATKLLCEGNGIDAVRKNDWAQNDAERKLAEASEKSGGKTFDIIGGCSNCGCPFATGEKKACKPHSRLSFQLANAPTIGGTCVYDTTGNESARNLVSCLTDIRSITGHGVPEDGPVAGIPLWMNLYPYRTRYKEKGVEKTGTQYAIALRLSARDAVSLYRGVITQAEEFRQLTTTPQQLEAGSIPATVVTDEPVAEALTEEQEAAAIHNEFYTNYSSEDDANGDEPAAAGSGPKLKEDPPSQPKPAEDPAELVAAIERFKKTDREGKLATFDEMNMDLTEAHGNEGTMAYYACLKHHGVNQPGEFAALKNGGQIAAACFRDLWIVRARPKG